MSPIAPPLGLVLLSLSFYCSVLPESAGSEINLVSNADTLEVGRTLELNCTTNNDDAGDVTILHDDVILSKGYKFSKEQVHVTVVIPNATCEDAGLYLCVHNTSTIPLFAAVNVLVGHFPEAPRLIGCVSENFENMTCQWDPPVKTDLCIPSVWKIKYTVNSSEPPSEKCESYDPNSITCVWSKRDKTDVRDAFKPGFIYTLIASATNRMGTAITRNEINTTTIVKPAPVYDLSSAPVNSSCVQLTWNLTFPPGFLGRRLVYSVTAVNDIAVNKTGMMSPADDLYVPILVDGLHPFTNYTFTVRVKPEFKGFWSEGRHTGSRTLEAAPDVGPGLSSSSFTDGPTESFARNVYLYWKAPDPSTTHGQITGYEVTVTNLDTLEVVHCPSHIGSDRRFGLQTADRYRVDIKARNRAGVSRSESSLLLPSSPEVLPPVQKMEAEHNGTHVTVAWEPIPSGTRVTSVTVHYCKGVIMQPSKVVANCSGFYNWTRLERTSESWSVKLEKPEDYVFGVSVESADETSGTAWISCLFQQGKVPGKIMEVEAREARKESVDLIWRRLICGQSAPSKVLRFEVSSLSKSDEIQTSCDRGEIVEIPGDWELESTSLSGLQPSTWYRICVRAVSPIGAGPWSEVLEIRTLANVTLIVVIAVGAIIILGLGIVLFFYLWIRLRSPMKITIPEPVADSYCLTYRGTSSDRSYEGVQENPVYTISDNTEVLLSNGAVVQDVSNVGRGIETGDRRRTSTNSSGTSDIPVAIAKGAEVSTAVLSQQRDPMSVSAPLANRLSSCVSYSRLTRVDTSTASGGRTSGETTRSDPDRVVGHSELSRPLTTHRLTSKENKHKDLAVEKLEVLMVSDPVVSGLPTTTKHTADRLENKDSCKNDDDSVTNEYDEDTDIDSFSYQKAHILSD